MAKRYPSETLSKGLFNRKQTYGEFPGGLVVKIPGFLWKSSIPGQGTEIPQALQHSQKTIKLKDTKGERKGGGGIN